MKKHGSRKPLLLLFLLVLLLLAAIGVTYAQGFHSLSLKNQVRTATVEGVITENFPNDGIYWEEGKINTKEVSFANEGSADVFLRISVGENWIYTEPNGDTVALGSVSDDIEVAEKIWTSDWEENWQDGGDGWMYYKKVLKAGTSTEKVLTGIDFHDVNDMRYGDASYALTFQMEMVQASDEEAVAHGTVQELFSRDFSTGTTEADGWINKKYDISLNWQNE